MKYFKIIIVAALVFMSGYTAQAQRNTVINNNAWLVYNGDHKVSDKWGVHLEMQVRRNELLSKPMQLLPRVGINYYFNPQVMATAGYAYVETDPYGKFPVTTKFGESRAWEQIQIKNQFNRVEQVNRIRLEQRFVNLPVRSATDGTYKPGPAVYSNRIRLQNRIAVPLNGKTIVDKSVYVTAADEIFVNFGKNVGKNIFDQNRAYAAIGYKVPKLGRVEAGYLWQVVAKSDGIRIESNHTLQVGIFSTIDFYKKK